MGDSKKNTLVFMIGLSLRWMINHGFDYVLYPIILVWLGNEDGAVVLTILATIINVLIIRVYDWSKTDWLLIEKIKHMGEREDHTGWKAHVFKFARKNKVLTFLVLCADDPVTVTLYFRKGSYQYNGMSARDWKIFIASNVVSNLYWVGGWVAAIELVKSLFEFF